MHHSEITKKFLKFFTDNNHNLLPSASLIPPETDTSALFTTSGMHPLKPYFLGIKKPPSKRLCSIQKCLRTADIDDVGKTIKHCTFFFMLGSWSIGDYFKEQAIKYAYELLVNQFGFDKNRLWATVFKGNDRIPKDAESIEAWKKAGIPSERIVELGEKDNFWSAGPTGPCGPCTEVHYDMGKEAGCKRKDCNPSCDCKRFVEIWNAGVFMMYNRNEKGALEKLPFNSVDTGAGLERLAMVLQKKNTIFETTLFSPLIEYIERKTGRKLCHESAVVAEHCRASVFAICDGVMPGKMGREYVLRRLLRRAVRFGRKIGLKPEDYIELCRIAVDIYSADWKELNEKKELMLNVVKSEIKKFSETLEKGEKLIESCKKNLSGAEAFHLYDTFGFPIELTVEAMKEKGFDVDLKGFEEEFEKHKEKSKASIEKKFRGGLADASEQTTKLHTASHLLNSALRQVLKDKNIHQKGSNITSERLRFDFNFPRKLTADEIREIEDIVNKKINEAIEVKKQEMTLEQAKKSGFAGVFENKYSEKVTVYSIDKFSMEICGGPHVKNTKELGKFKIIKEESISEGTRRIKAVLN